MLFIFASRHWVYDVIVTRLFRIIVNEKMYHDDSFKLLNIKQIKGIFHMVFYFYFYFFFCSLDVALIYFWLYVDGVSVNYSLVLCISHLISSFVWQTLNFISVMLWKWKSSSTLAQKNNIVYDWTVSIKGFKNVSVFGKVFWLETLKISFRCEQGTCYFILN